MKTDRRFAAWAIAALLVIIALCCPGCDDDSGANTTAQAALTGAQVAPPVVTEASAAAILEIAGTRTVAELTLDSQALDNVTTVTIHVGAPGEEGPVILRAFVQPESQELIDAGAGFTDPLARELTIVNLVPQPLFAIEDFEDAVEAILAGETYIQVSTETNPDGEVRGQLLP